MWEKIENNQKEAGFGPFLESIKTTFCFLSHGNKNFNHLITFLQKSQDSEEFAVDNDDIFQNISSHHHNHHSWTKNENRNLNE